MSFQRHLKICPFSKVSDAAEILQVRQDRKRVAEEQEIYPKITHLNVRIEIIKQVFCNLLQYRSPTRPALIEVSVIAQTDFRMERECALKWIKFFDYYCCYRGPV